MTTGLISNPPFAQMPRPTMPVAARLALIANCDAGLKLDPSKLDFFAQRVGTRLRALGLERYEDYLAFIESAEGESERTQFVESMTTHTTDFFRENTHYDYLKSTALPALTEAGAGRAWPIRVWSAACSSGAELYSALITVLEYAQSINTLLRIEGVGTDISSQILKKAKAGVYDSSEIAGLSEGRRRAYLMQHRGGLPKFMIAPKLKQMCSWELTNLTETSPQGPVQADIIFVRNVLIYFDKVTQRRVIETLANRLRPGGYLMTGHSESLSEIPDTLQSVAFSTYRKIV